MGVLERKLYWDDVDACILDLDILVRKDHPLANGSIRIYGIPTGGSFVARLLSDQVGFELVSQPEDCDVLIDDVYDSGRTYDLWTSAYHKPFYVLCDKRDDDWQEVWVTFPWERGPQADGEQAVVRLLQSIGEDPTRDGLRDTPRRVHAALRELTEGRDVQAEVLLSTTFDERHDEMVVLSQIPFWSLCEHHLMPFHGHVAIGYLPNGKVVGLSKLARLVESHARRLQVQERMTEGIVSDLVEHLKPKGAGCVIEANHTCMAMRGVRSEGLMTTSALAGLFREESAVKSEFLALCRTSSRR